MQQIKIITRITATASLCLNVDQLPTTAKADCSEATAFLSLGLKYEETFHNISSASAA